MVESGRFQIHEQTKVHNNLMDIKSTPNSNQQFHVKRWGNSRLASRSPSMPNSPGGKRTQRCRHCFGNHNIAHCPLANVSSVSASPLRSMTPGNSRKQGLPGNSKAYSRPCKYFAIGKCLKGANCTFLHDNQIPADLISKSPTTNVPNQNGISLSSSGMDMNSNPSSKMFNGASLQSQMLHEYTYDPTKSKKVHKIPAALNLNMQENTENESNLRPASPQNVARSRPSSRATTTSSGSSLHTQLRLQSKLHSKLAKLTRSRPSEDSYQQPDGGLYDSKLPVVYTPDHQKASSPRFDFPRTSNPNQVISASMPPDVRRMKDAKCTIIDNQRSSSVTPAKAFTRPCKYYAQGFCVKGSACTFLHSHQDSLALSDRLSAQQGAKNPEKAVDPSKMFVRLCRYYIKNQCVKGKNCTFIHPTPEQLRRIKIGSVSPSLGPMAGSKSVPTMQDILLNEIEDTRSLNSAMNVMATDFRPGAFRHTPSPRNRIGDDSILPEVPENIFSPTRKSAKAVEFRPTAFRQSPRIQFSEASDSPRKAAKAVEFRPTAFRQSPRILFSQASDSPRKAGIQAELQRMTSVSQSPRTCVNKAVAPPVISSELSSEAMFLVDRGSLECTNINQSKAKTKLCKFYALGECLKGDRCTFIHEERTPEKSVLVEPQVMQLPVENSVKRVSSPRFARVENRAYSFNELDDIEDYVAGLNAAKKQTVANSNVAAVVLTFDSEMQEEINNTLSEIHNTIKQLNKESEENEYSVFVECYDLGCTNLPPQQIADDIRRSDMDFQGRREALCQPRFGHILQALKQKRIIPKNSAYLFQIEAVNEKYAFKYPYANISMVFQKGDKGERIEQVAIRGLFEKQHVILDRKLWDKAFKARAPPIYLPYFLTGEQLAKYPESRRVWFCGAHSLFVPILKNVEFIKLQKGENWPSGADVPSRYAANPVPAPTLFISTARSKKNLIQLERTESSDEDVVPDATVQTGV